MRLTLEYRTQHGTILLSKARPQHPWTIRLPDGRSFQLAGSKTLAIRTAKERLSHEKTP